MVSLKMLMLLVLVISLVPQIKAEPVQCRYTSLECKSTNSTSEDFETNCCLYGEAKSKKSCYILCKKNVKSGQCRGYCGNYLEACEDTLTTKSPSTPSKSQKTTLAQSSDDKHDKHMSKEKICYQAEGESTNHSYKILFFISLAGNFALFCIVLVLIYYLPSCTIPRCVSIINSCIRSCFHCCLYAKSRRSTNNRTPPSSKTASSYRASYNHGAVRILRDAEEDDNADSDCEMLPNKSADFSKTTYTNADLQSLDSKA